MPLCVSIDPELLALYDDYETIKTQHSENAGNEAERAKNELIVTNMKSLGDDLMMTPEPIGEGGYGTVYEFDYKETLQSRATPAVAKVIFFSNDNTTEEGEHEQELLKSELAFNQELRDLDEKNLFFPKYYGFYDVTEYFQDLATLLFDEEFIPMLDQTENGKNALVIQMEKLDFDLSDYQLTLTDNWAPLYFHTRCQIGESVLKGLVAMFPKYSHCDIKPQNIMAKMVNDDQIQDLSDDEIERIELFPGQFYQVKIIDFGVVVKGNPGERRCPGGSPGFLADEYFTIDSHALFDVFSMAVTMIDMEMALLGFEKFSDFLKPYHLAIFAKTGISQDHQDQIKEFRFFQKALDYSNSATVEVRHAFFTNLRGRLGSLERDVVKKFRDIPENIALKKWVFLTPEILKHSLFAAFEIYMSSDFFEDKKTKTERAKAVKLYKTRKLKTFEEGSEEFKILKEEIEYWTNQEIVTDVTGRFQQQLILFCFNQIHEYPEDRSSLEGFLSKVQELKNGFIGSVGDQVKYILKYNRYYQKKVHGRFVQRDMSMESYENSAQVDDPSFRLDDNFRMII